MKLRLIMPGPLGIFSITLFSILSGVLYLNSSAYWGPTNSFESIYNLSRKQRTNEILIWEKLFNQRAWVKARLDDSHGNKCPEVLILGSSTVGGLAQHMFARRKILNAWMGSPAVEDYEAFFSMMSSTGCVPIYVVIGVDPWLANPNHFSDSWQFLVEDHARYHSEGKWISPLLHHIHRTWTQFKECLSFVATRESTRRLWKRKYDAQPRLLPFTPEVFCELTNLRSLLEINAKEVYLRGFDGHYVRCKEFSDSPQNIQELAHTYLIRNIHEMAHWPRVDALRMEKLANVTKRWVSSGSRVIFLAPPYHPITFKLLKNHPDIETKLSQLDKMILNIADEVGGDYLNLRNPADIQCSENDFEDSHHAKPTCLKKIVFLLEKTFR